MALYYTLPVSCTVIIGRYLVYAFSASFVPLFAMLINLMGWVCGFDTMKALWHHSYGCEDAGLLLGFSTLHRCIMQASLRGGDVCVFAGGSCCVDDRDLSADTLVG